MLNFSKVMMRYEPYPLAVIRPALDPALYAELSDNYPDASLFGQIDKYPYKLSLSEKFAAGNYHRFITGNGPWKRFHAWLKSDDFIRQTVSFLKDNHIDLPLDDHFETVSGKLARYASALGRGHLPDRRTRLRTRFEFSVLKADGGEVAPHTDTPRKMITMVLSMIKDGEWDPKFGGGLQVNRATDPEYAFNWKNRMVPWDKIETLETLPFLPNQCVVFVKTFNSLHSVQKMTQTGSSALRRTITIVIERN